MQNPPPSSLLGVSRSRPAALDLALCAVIALAPTVFLPGLSFHYDVTPKAVAVVWGAAAVLVLSAWGRRRLSTAIAPERRALSAVMGLAAVSLIAATVFSERPELSFAGSNWRRMGLPVELAVLVFAWALLARLAARRETLRLALRVGAAAGFFVACYGALQYFGVDPFLPTDAYRVGEGVWAIIRPPSTLGQAGYFATYLLHAAAFGAALAVSDLSRNWRRFGWIVASVSAAAIVLSGTRSAMLGLAAGGAFAYVALRPRLTRKAVAAAAVTAILALGFYLSPGGERLRARVRWASEDVTGGPRLNLWRDSLAMGAERWAAGFGLETFSSAYPRYKSWEPSRAYPDLYQESPHNVFLDVFVSQGALGTVPLLGAAVLVLAVAFRLRGASPAALCLGAGFLGALCSNQFLSLTIPTAFCFWTTAAMIVAAAAKPAGKRAEAARGQAAWRIAASSALAAALAWYGASLAAADLAAARTRSAIEHGAAEEALASYEQVRRYAPPGLSFDLWFSRALAFAPGARMATPRVAEAALAAAERAARDAEDRHNALYSLAAIYAELDRAEAVESTLLKAAEAAPTWYKPHWMLARLWAMRGRTADALREAQLAHNLSGGAIEEVERTWSELRETSGGSR